MEKFKAILKEVSQVFPLQKTPLVHCITNEITCETMANTLLYIDAKPVMADDIREFPEFFDQSDSLLLNLGHISEERVTVLLTGAKLAHETQTPAVLDLVGVSATRLRYDLAWEIADQKPQVIKGNLSEMRAFCGLSSTARGVDGSREDQTSTALAELTQVMKQVATKLELVLLATGPRDLVVAPGVQLTLTNGVAQLDRFTGSGDLLGALIAALLGSGVASVPSVVAGVSYVNIAGERAQASRGLAAFRTETLNQLSLLMAEDWWQDIRRVVDET